MADFIEQIDQVSEIAQCISVEDAINTVMSLQPDHINIEGSPVYFFPEHSSQMWDSSEFQVGWQVAEAIWGRAMDTGVPVTQWMLADNYNNSPCEDFQYEFPEYLKDQQGNSQMEVDELFYESDLAQPGKDTCARMEAQFQIRKLEQAYLSGERPLAILVHPTSFKSQQTGMFDFLQAEIKQGILKDLPKAARKSFLENTFMHIWIDESGQIESITQPKWNWGGLADHYGHRPIDMNYEN